MRQYIFLLGIIVHLSDVTAAEISSAEKVSEAYQFYAGQNILNARDVDFVDVYIQGQCSIENLKGLFLALKDFFDQESNEFIPKELNSGYTLHNFMFLKGVFDQQSE